MKAAKFALLAFISTLSLAPDLLSAQEPQHHHDADEKLGTVYFLLPPALPQSNPNSSAASPFCIPSSTK